jgi:hypothetical protein
MTEANSDYFFGRDGKTVEMACANVSLNISLASFRRAMSSLLIALLMTISPALAAVDHQHDVC